MPIILFGYKCGIQTSTRFSLNMIVIRRSSRLKANNFLNSVLNTFDEDDDPAILAK